MVKAMLASVVAAAAMAVVIALGANTAEAMHSAYYGHYLPRDSDGYVPEYYGTVGTCYDGILGRASWSWNSYGTVRFWITYDSCEMQRMGATAEKWRCIKAHERAHSRGWGHWERPAAYNPAYFPRC